MSDALAYTRTAIVLHWLTVLLVCALFGLGWYMGDLPKGPWRGEMIALHKSLGITVFLLTLGRGYWRLRYPPPALPAALPLWQSRLAQGVQRLFYVLLLAQPLLGYLSSSFTPYKTRYLGLQLPVWAAPDPAFNEFFTELHEAGAPALLLVIALHVAGAASHGLRQGDSLVRRMWRW